MVECLPGLKEVLNLRVGRMGVGWGLETNGRNYHETRVGNSRETELSESGLEGKHRS